MNAVGAPPFQDSLATSAMNGVLSVLLAPVCAACAGILDTPLSGCVCQNCWEQVHPVTDLIFKRGAPLHRLVAVGEYDGVFRDIIHALKYQGRRSVALDLAALMRRSGDDLLSGADCIVPVPLHWRREYARGFNQAREIARRLGPPLFDALRRARATAAQVELSADQRRANVRDAFVLRRPSPWWTPPALDGLRIILVDDVATTGATLEACARVLRKAGAFEVSGLTAARKI